VFALLCLLGTLVMSSRSGALESLDWKALSRGAIIIEDTRDATGLPGLRAGFAVEASRSRIWTVLTDYDHYSEIFPRVRRLRVLTTDERGATLEYWGDAIVSDIHYVLRRSYDTKFYTISWQRVAGDLNRIEGSWQIIDGPRPNLHALIYESFVDIGVPIVGTMLRPLAKREIRRMAERLRVWIETE